MRHIFRASGLSMFKPTETQFFIDVITTTLKDRQTKGATTRNDLIDMMLKAVKGDITDAEDNESKEQFDLDSELKNHQKAKKKEFDEMTIVATSMIMLIAGYFFNLKSQVDKFRIIKAPAYFF
jgi:prolyl oligopeptidase PreP (S9A serine peptidase family)